MQTEQPTFFYRIFEKTLNLFKSNLSTTTPPAITLPPNDHVQTPLQKELHTFETSIQQLKKLAPKIKGTKLFYMIQRFEKERVYLYV
jgi:hypothetical protein